MMIGGLVSLATFGLALFLIAYFSRAISASPLATDLLMIATASSLFSTPLFFVFWRRARRPGGTRRFP
jgi:hypothetical protein